MAESTDLNKHEPFGVSTKTVILTTGAFLSLIAIALVLVTLLFGWWGIQHGATEIRLPVVRQQPRLQVRPAEDLAELRKAHREQLEKTPTTIEEAMDIVSRRDDPLAPISEAERKEAGQ